MDEATQPQRTFRVGLRAQTGIYFPKDDTLTLRNFPSEVGPIDLVFGVNRFVPEGFTHPVRFGLWIDVTGPAPSLGAAVETFGNVARGMTAIISLTANTAIEDSTADVAVETSPGSDTREYWSREGPGYDWPQGFGRGILTQVPQLVIEALFSQPADELERLFRAIVQYSHAVQNWTPGSEIAALSHIWIGMESLTKLFRARRAAELGMDLNQLRERYAAERSTETGETVVLKDLNALDGEIRRRHFFQGDDGVYQIAKKASDAYEHSFNPLWEVREQALKALEPAGAYLRQAILEMLGIDDKVKALLLSPLFRLPYSDALGTSLHGELIGPGEVIDAIESYPDIEWMSEPFQLDVDAEEDATIGYRTRIATQSLPLGVTFKPIGMDVTASPAVTEGTDLRIGTSEAEIAEGIGTAWQDVTVSGRPASTVLIGDLFANPITTDGESAISFQDSFEYRVETTTMPETGVDRADLLRSAERVRREQENNGWELICVFPGSDKLSLSLVYRRSAPDS